ncbi:DUF2807 domain-containing protein [Zymomonas mobilis]|nr:DUF2807 domain-containing protein [Zymomonas mobilis]
MLIVAIPVAFKKIRPFFSSEIGQSYRFQPFNNISLAGVEDAEIIVGGDYAVNVQGSSQAVKSLDMQFQNNSLHILHKKKVLDFFSHYTKPAKIRIILPTLKTIVSSGSSTVSVKGDVKNDLTVVLSGSGNIVISGKIQENTMAVLKGSGQIFLSDIDADKVVSNVFGSGDIKLAGESHSYTGLLMGSGKIDISQLQSKEGHLSLMGSGDIEVNPAVDMSAWKISKTGSGTIQPKKA